MKQINGLNCKEESCLFKQGCANHTSAGDFRSEGGFTPEIILKDDKLYCQTIERKAAVDHSPYSSHGEILPENHSMLGRGSIIKSNNGYLVYQGPHGESEVYVPPDDEDQANEELLVASDLLEEKGLLHAANTLRNLTRPKQ